MKKKWRTLVSVVLIAVLAWAHRLEAGFLAALARVTGGYGSLAWASTCSLKWLAACGTADAVARSRVSMARGADTSPTTFVGMFFNLVLPTSIGGDMTRTWYLRVTRQAFDVCRAKSVRSLGFMSVTGDRLNVSFPL